MAWPLGRFPTSSALRSPRSASSLAISSPHLRIISATRRSHALFPPQLRLYLFQTHRTLRRQGHRSRRAIFRRCRDPAFRPRDALLPYVSRCLATRPMIVIFPPLFSRCHSPDSPMAMAVHITVFPNHYQLVHPLLLRLHRIPGLRR